MSLFRVLGPLEFHQASGWSRVRMSKCRSLLAALLAQAGYAVAVETLVTELWGEHPPQSAPSLVRGYVRRLRCAVADVPATDLLTQSPGYMLRVPAEEIDTAPFEALCAEGREALARGETDHAAHALERALRLWRGRAYADVEAGPLVSTESDRLEEARLVALETRIDADLARGLHDRLIPELRLLVAQHGLRERFWGQQMIALYRSGRRAEALKTYDEARRVISRELGVDPSGELQRLFTEILRSREPAGRVPAAEPAAKAAGDGGWLTWEVPIRQLPTDVPDFTAREDEVARMTAILAEPQGRRAAPIVALWGMPGVGKTCLAVHVAHRVGADYPDGHLHVQLAGSSARPREPRHVLAEMLRALGVHDAALPKATEERAALYRSRLDERRILVVLDDARSVAQVTDLVPGSPSCAVIITSRSQLAILPGAHTINVRSLVYGSALELLHRIVGSDRLRTEPEAASTIVAACGKLPLAIRIAGTRLITRPTWPAAVLAERLADSRRRLDELRIGDVSVRTSIASSYDALEELPGRLFRNLGAFESRDLADWAITSLAERADIQDIDALIDAGLLAATHVDAFGFPRFWLHQLVHAYATEEFGKQSPQQRDAAIRRLANCWTNVTATVAAALPRIPYIHPVPEADCTPFVTGGVAARFARHPISWFEAESENLAAVITAVCGGGHHRRAAALARCMEPFHTLHSRADEAERVWATIHAASMRAQDRLAVADAELHLANAKVFRGRHAEAMAMLAPCVAEFERFGDAEGLKFAKLRYGYCASECYDLDAAEAALADALTLARAAGDDHGELMALREIGNILARRGDVENGLDLLQQALKIADDNDLSYSRLVVVGTCASASTLAGRHGEAIEFCHTGLALARRFGHPLTEAYLIGKLGDAHMGMGAYGRGVALLREAAGLFAMLGDRRGEALAWQKQAMCHHALGNNAAARELAERALTVFRELQLPHQEARVRRLLRELSCQ